jgi:hypothetical protein
MVFKGLKGGSSAVDISLARLLDDSLPDPNELPVMVTDGFIQVNDSYRIYIPIVRR